MSKNQTIDNNFLKDNKFDKENFRIYVWNILIKIKSQLDEDFRNPYNLEILQKIKDYCAVNKNEVGQKSISELINLKNKVDEWIRETVESEQRFEFFILSKASEIASGNQDNDYYYAMTIRHDQLMAAVKILKKLEELWQKIKKGENMTQLVNSTEFSFWGENSLEKLIFLEAERIYQDRIGQR